LPETKQLIDRLIGWISYIEISQSVDAIYVFTIILALYRVLNKTVHGKIIPRYLCKSCTFLLFYYFALVRVRGIVINPSVCVSVCLSASISLEPPDRSTRNFVCADPLWQWLGPPPAALRYVMYFRFMDDVTLGRNGRDAERWRLTRFTRLP